MLEFKTITYDEKEIARKIFVRRKIECKIVLTNIEVAYCKQGNFVICCLKIDNFGYFVGVAKRNVCLDKNNQKVGERLSFVRALNSFICEGTE